MTRKQRKRNIICFRPPFSKNVATKIGRYFLNLIDKHFSRDHKFHKIFNRKNKKVSYSCMQNIRSAINSHNRFFTHLLATKVEHVIVLQTALYMKNA